jgi:DNA-binding protein H-NS
MAETASLTTELLTSAAVVEEMAATVLLVGEWLLKQQQQLAQQQRLLEEKQRQLDAQQKQIEELADALDKLKNRSSKNSSTPPSQDQLKKPSDKTKRNKGKKRRPKYDHQGKTPDNNDAERALRPIVVHRKVSGTARSDWGAQLVAQMFSFLETVRLQGGDALAQLCELLSLAGRSPPGLPTT